MKFNKLFLACVFLLVIFIMGSVSASDNVTSHIQATNDDESCEIELGSDVDESYSSANFKDLSNLVDVSEGSSEINLTYDYAYNQQSDSGFEDGIEISKNLSIDGQNHMIDAKGKCIFSIRGSDVTIKNIIFKNARINCNANNTSIINCSFTDCFSHDDGGAVYSNGANTLIVNCTFRNCSSEYNGGAVYSEDDSCNFINSTFINCSAFYYGGAIHSTSNDTVVIGVEFINCSAAYGDAIYFAAKFRLENSSFVNGGWYAIKGGDIVNVVVDDVAYGIGAFENLTDNETLVLSKDYLLFSPISINAKNIVIDGGGNSITFRGIFRIAGENATIMNCNFENCTEGVLFVDGLNCRVINCSFTGFCNDVSLGGALFINQSNCSVEDCRFIDCRSYSYEFGEYSCPTRGGSVSIKSSNCRIVNCSFVYFCYYRDCGAIYSSGGNCSILKCTFLNFATDYGGAINSEGDSLLVVDCIFRDCYADGGGAICSNGDNCRIINCSFFNCSAYEGGALCSWKGKINIVGCSFIYCPDYNGNAVYVLDLQSSIVNSTFINYPIIASNLRMYYYDGSCFSVKVYDSDGNALSGESVVFKIDGKKLKTVKTDKKGIAKVKITKLPGNYKISAEAFGYTITKKLTVKKVLSLKKVKVKKSAKKLTLTATLKKGNTPIKNKKVTFKFNGKTYKAKTNKKGIAKVTVKKSVLKKLKVGKKIKYQATYVKSTVKYTVKVVK